MAEICRGMGDPPIMLLDLRPLALPTVVIASHEVAEQISRATRSHPYSAPKSPTMAHLVHLMGPRSIVTAQGEDWKALRKRFNSGFAPQYLTTLLPRLCNMTERFVSNLDRFAASGEEFSLGELCVNLTFDIIGAVTLDVDFRAQLGSDQSVELIKIYQGIGDTYDNMRWSYRWDPRLVRKRKKLGKRLHALLSEVVREKFHELKRDQAAGGRPSRSVLALALQDLDELDAATLDDACDQIKSFLFAGHDTTSILLQWVLYELSRTPRALAAARAELDALFGPDPSPEAFRSRLLGPGGDELLGKLAYTSAVVKEALRLYPPAGTARLTPPGDGFTVRLPEYVSPTAESAFLNEGGTVGGGRDVCLDGLVLYNCATIIQRDPAVYGPDADDFVPERWLGDSDTSVAGTDGHADAAAAAARSKTPASAWRPFERGPRNCIGQELANLEARVILAWVLRRYDLTKVGLGELDLDVEGRPVIDEKGRYRVKSELYNVSLTVQCRENCPLLTLYADKADHGETCRRYGSEGEVAGALSVGQMNMPIYEDAICIEVAQVEGHLMPI